jgi:hypothetical protein
LGRSCLSIVYELLIKRLIFFVNNKAAHMLVNHNFCNKISFTWSDEPPDFVNSVFANDISLFEFLIKLVLMGFPSEKKLTLLDSPKEIVLLDFRLI